MTQILFKSGWREALVRDVVGKKARTLVVFTTGYFSIPAGAVGTIESAHRGGYEIVFPKCECCSVRPRVTKCMRNMVEVLEDGDG